MSVPYVQREGIATFGESATPLTAFNGEIVNVQFKVSRATFEKPGTFANSDLTSIAGGTTREVTIEYLGDPSTVDSFWDLLKQQISTNDSLLYGTVKYEPGATSPTNKKYTYSALVTEFTIGAKVNEMWGMSVTFPVVDFSESDV